MVHSGGNPGVSQKWVAVCWEVGMEEAGKAGATGRRSCVPQWVHVPLATALVSTGGGVVLAGLPEGVRELGYAGDNFRSRAGWSGGQVL